MSILTPRNNRFLLHCDAHMRSRVDGGKFILSGAQLVVNNDDPITISQITGKARSLGCSAVITCSSKLLAKLLREDTASTHNHMGALFKHDGMEILIIPEPTVWMSVNYMSWLLKHYMTKLTRPDKWIPTTKFQYSVLDTQAELDEAANFLEGCEYNVIDIETPLHYKWLVIGDYGVTGIKWNDELKEYETFTFVVRVNDMRHVLFMRRVNANNTKKVGQNFQYDISYMHYYNCPVNNFMWDTATLMHCWLAELPKDLGFLGTFAIRDCFNWKGLRDSTNEEDQIRYNAMDTWGTANALLGLLAFIPKWVKQNYRLEFPVNFVCALASAQGMRVDMEVHAKAKAERLAAIDKSLVALRKMTATPSFNPASSQQKVKLLQTLGFKNITSADDKTLEACKNKSALARRIITAIQDFQTASKAVSTYLNEEDIWNGRMYFSVSPHATDTSRQAAKKHAFSFNGKTKTGAISTQRRNIGTNIQTIPRGDDDDDLGFKYGVKDYYVTDSDDWLFGEADFGQAESRDTAYITGEEALITAVECGKDFHSLNASAFFGVPYEQIYRDGKPRYYDNVTDKWVEATEGKTLNKPLRNLAKRTNHGANYNMGPAVMLATMGAVRVEEARRLLGLKPTLTHIQVCEVLLTSFAKAYPKVRNDYQEWIKRTVKQTGLLTNPYGWTRRCFGSPATNKPDLNAYIAHVPQSTNAHGLNKAALRVLYYAIDNADSFRFCIQIHDSIVFQYKRTHPQHAAMVPKLMEEPIEVTDISGVTRTMLVPADCNHGETSWGAIKG